MIITSADLQPGLPSSWDGMQADAAAKQKSSTNSPGK